MARNHRTGVAAAVGLVAVLALGAPLPTAHAGSARPLPAASPASSDGRCPSTDETLRQLAERSGKLVGTAYRNSYADEDPCYAGTAAREFNSITPEIATFTNALAPEPGPLRFDDADEVCQTADRHRQICQVHDIVWDPVDHPEWGIVPEWIRALDPAARRREMVSLVTGVARHFGGRAAVYTLANEVFRSDGTLTDSTWNTTGDDSYLFDAYRAARLADPSAVLLYNDYGAEDVNAKSDAVLDLATRLHDETVEVEIDGRTVARPLLDGVGLQMHVGTDPGLAPSPESVAANLARLGEAGLSVYVTEMDVRVPVVDGRADPAAVARQARLYQDLAAVCFDSAHCRGITLWGFTDARSWITDNPGTFSGQGSAHPFDTSYRPKAAHNSLSAALRAAPAARQEATTGRAGPSRPPGSEPTSEGDGAPFGWTWGRTAAIGATVVLVGVGLAAGTVRRRRATGGDG